MPFHEPCPTQVAPACLELSGLLDATIIALTHPPGGEEPQGIGQLVAIHVLGGALSLSRGRSLFPQCPPPAAPAHSSGMVSNQSIKQTAQFTVWGGMLWHAQSLAGSLHGISLYA